MASDYFNPGSTRPQSLGLPGLDGLEHYYDRQMYQRFMDLQEHKNRALNDTYDLDAPVREAARPAAIAKSGLETLLNQGRQAPEMVEATLAGEKGDAQTRSARGFVDQGSRQTTLDSKNMRNISDQLDMAADQMEAMAATNPAMGQAQWKQMRESMPKHIQAQFPENYTPEVPVLIKRFAESQRNNLAHQRSTELQNQKDVAAGERNKETADAARYGHELRLEAAWARMGGRETQRKVEGVIHQYLMQKMEGKVPTTPQQDQTFQVAQQIMMNVRAAAGIASDPNLIPSQVLNNAAPTPRPTPAPATFPNAAAAQAVSDIQKQVEAAGYKYEPEIYNYRIKPGSNPPVMQRDKKKKDTK